MAGLGGIGLGFITIALVIIILFTAFGTIKNSTRSRHAEKGEREALRAKMNMHMGVMFLCIAALQFTSFSGAAFQFIIAILIAMLGLFNLFAGYRNFQQFRQFLK